MALDSNRVRRLYPKCQTNESRSEDEDPVGLNWGGSPPVLPLELL